MRYRTIVVLIVVAACIGGCTTAANVQATAPSSTAPITLATTTMPPTPTSTSASPTTTVDRVTEVTRIFEDLERRRLAAIYSGDVEAFNSVYANDAYRAADSVSFDTVAVVNPDLLTASGLSIRHMDTTCVAFDVTIDPSQAIRGSEVYREAVVLELGEQGWGYSWLGGGWSCVGPHPLSSPAS
jgi:hypothetical protein